ncbi:bifunctional cytochrome P450/NADPH--P450 reductase [Erythrobacter litoralis]|uniref:Bifunctional cytochrome P450/NADPH--P450 reductase n=1 Tax=Erythrobacter litoralis (strain HTCC2594) TaxID=314225 RepID=Q2NDX9_ERYLH|nr:cytochrome P450 [Erythrobacter litoralis]ABC62112.1 probable bifunctional P-450:NADPH-P450 reductase [Erythrobacter litoralis HTCC2594]
MDAPTALAPIPQPPGKPIVGNAFTVDSSRLIQSLMELAEEYGPIFQLEVMGTPLVFVSGADMVAEICDESRFDKTVRGPLKRLRLIAGDGLFTGDTDDPNWAKAHHILLPSFSQKAMGSYLPMMTDIASQLMLKWERLNSDDVIDVPMDMVRLTLDTIGVCGFGYRFNSFYREDFHPFIEALNRTLDTTQKMRGLPGEKLLKRQQIEQLNEDAAYMNNLVDEIIRERRQTGESGQGDLLDFMLSGRDPVTGERLSDENIRYQINTFLIAGHETTSGLLSFTLYYLLKNRDVLQRAYAEVDEVLGRNIDQTPTLSQIGRLPYIRAILSEALRLWPTAPAMGLAPFEDEVLGGKYAIAKGTFTTVLIPSLHRDKLVWGENPEAFNPDNFSPKAEAARPPHAYKPFGNGQRACIGRQFAIQESILVLGMLLQRFELFDHADYQLRIKETLSIKPDGFTIKARLRHDVERGGVATVEPESKTPDQAAAVPSHGTPLLVLYGSNLGSSEGFARELAQRGEFSGFDVTMAPLDAHVAKLPTDGAVAIACASYNGMPPDNAAKFVDWLEQADAADAPLSNVSYLVLGCGNSDWAATFQVVPRKIDALMEQHGAERLVPAEELDARGDLDTQFHDWLDGLIPQLGDAFDIDLESGFDAVFEPLYTVEITDSITGNTVADRVGAREVEVVANRELKDTSKDEGRSTRHLEVRLPEGMEYEPGDHLCVVPVNDPAVVDRLLKRFGLDRDTFVRIESRSDMRGPFPSGSTFSVLNLAETAGELQAVATRKDIATLARYSECPNSRAALEALAAPPSADGTDRYTSEVLEKRRSVLDMLEEFPACDVPLAVFLELIPFLSPRYYSISSAPEANQGLCSITVGVVKGPALAGTGEFKGTCSAYLADLPPGDRFRAVVRKPTAQFRLPDNPETPVIMIGPGTGVAPFRAFLQRRDHLQEDGAVLGEAMLFFGCRHPDIDYLYREELDDYDQRGVATVHAAFSRHDGSRTYVQDLIAREADRVWELIEQDARIYVCGDGARMEPDVRKALMAIYAEKKSSDEASAKAWIDDLVAQDRYLLDVWVG